MVDNNTIRVGSRKSELALIQTKHVIASLQKLYPNDKFEIHTMTTMGDRVLNISLPKIGEKALFTKDLEDALHSGRVDFVVHSLKDLPTMLPVGMAIGAILEREDPRDALVLRQELAGQTLASLVSGSIIGTSSLRRGAQLARKYPHLVVEDIRGNLNTRLAKLDAPNSKFAGIILAQAGLQRMGWEHRVTQTLDSDDILYAVGQGALAVECRSNDVRILQMLQKLCCLKTQCKILTERSFLKTLGGGCSAPVAVITNLKRKSTESGDRADHHELHITGAVWSLDGSVEVQSNTSCLLNLSDQASLHQQELIPCKRAKLCASPEPNGTVQAKPVSPIIVDDTKLPIPSGSDMSAILKIHGDLISKCPYAARHKAAGDSDKCPMDFVVGQDVMGQCPYLNSEQKILASDVKSSIEQSSSTCRENHASAECPVKSHVGRDVMGQCPYLSADLKRKLPTSENATLPVASQAKCPFSTGKKPSVDETDRIAPAIVEPKLPISDEKLVPQVCPFAKTASSTEVANNAPSGSNKSTDTEESDDTVDDTTLYCGLYRHQCYNIDWFEKCEILGQSLAKNLIEKGALKVMEKAQLEIRKAI